MNVRYSKEMNCYIAPVLLKVDKKVKVFYAVIDTGASKTTISVEALVGKKTKVKKMVKQLDTLAQESGVRYTAVHGVVESPSNKKPYAYAACFEGAVVGGDSIGELRINILINGEKDIFVIGNDFLNMCKYQHEAGEYQLIIEKFNVQKYHESFKKGDMLDNEQLSTFLFSLESEEEVAASDEDAVYAELMRKGDEIMKSL